MEAHLPQDVVVRSPVLVARIGARARTRTTIRESFNPLVVGRQVRDRLAIIARWHPG
jgi:hypothetical protein